MADQPIDFLTLPGFAEAKKRLEETGRPTEWITAVVDTSEKWAAFLPKGRSWYKSPCEHYEGFWLLGCIGSVQCRACDSLLPGLMWETTCKNREKFGKCPFYWKGEQK